MNEPDEPVIEAEDYADIPVRPADQFGGEDDPDVDQGTTGEEPE